MDVSKIDSIEFEGVDWSDYPDFCDVVVVAASWDDGRDLTEDEIDELMDKHGGFVYDRLMDKLF
jgi:hypothetical protein